MNEVTTFSSLFPLKAGTMVSLHCQFVCIWNHLGRHTSAGACREAPLWMWVSPSQGWCPGLNEKRRNKKRSTSVHLSLRAHCRATPCPCHHSFLTMVDRTLKPWTKISFSYLKMRLVRYSTIEMKKKKKTWENHRWHLCSFFLNLNSSALTHKGTSLLIACTMVSGNPAQTSWAQYWRNVLGLHRRTGNSRGTQTSHCPQEGSRQSRQ